MIGQKLFVILFVGLMVCQVNSGYIRDLYKMFPQLFSDSSSSSSENLKLKDLPLLKKEFDKLAWKQLTVIRILSNKLENLVGEYEMRLDQQIRIEQEEESHITTESNLKMDEMFEDDIENSERSNAFRHRRHDELMKKYKNI